MTTATETVSDRLSRLGLQATSEARMETLAIAHPHVDDATFARIASATRVKRSPNIVLPAHRFESLSRGSGWARKSRGDSAEWGERVEGGYRVGPGRWTVAGSDGFSRKKENVWNVQHVTVGDKTWTIAS
jgi:hypothetical protein